MKNPLLTLFTLLMLACFPNFASAHVLVGSGSFMSGFTHPIIGFDHLLAMLCVGILSAQMGGKSIWKVPAAFVLMMLFGGVLGINGIKIASVELGIILSVLILGVSITCQKKLPVSFTMLFVGFFAVFHGNAHGIEMPTFSQPFLYGLGFALGTAVIHFSGVLITFITHKFNHGAQLLRYIGAGITGVGCHLLLLLYPL